MKIFCPFDELGCKFGHDDRSQDGHTVKDKSEFIRKEIKELKKLIHEGIYHEEEFHTSTRINSCPVVTSQCTTSSAFRRLQLAKSGNSYFRLSDQVNVVRE